MQETQVRSLGWEDPLEKGMATHSSILAWKTLWTGKPGGLQSSGSKKRTNSATKQQQREGVFLSHSQIQYATIGHSKLLTCIDCVYWWFSSKEPACNAGDPGSIPRSGRSPGGGNGSPLQYSCLGNSMDREA